MEVFKQILLLLGGLGVFLYGLHTMSESLQKSAGDNLKKIFDKLTSNKLKGVAVGAGSTAILQSSTAVTVIVVGFVNAGIIGLPQAAAVIMGANIGTTVTAFLLALPFTEFIAALGCVGGLMMLFSKNETVKKVAMVLTGFGALFVGIIVMNGAMAGFAPQLQNFFKATSNPFLLLLIGMLFTVVIQSSSAATGILIALAATVTPSGDPTITMDAIMFVLLGVNIGTCLTTFLAAIGASPNARRASLIHVLFNVFGAILVGGLLLINPVRGGIVNVLSGINDIKMQIAVFHMGFNIFTTAVLLPLAVPLVKLTTLIIKEKPPAEEDGSPVYTSRLSELMLSAPVLAIAQVKSTLIDMYRLSVQNFDLAIEAITTRDLSRKEEFDKRENIIDALNKEIPAFIVQIAGKDISLRDEVIIGSYHHVASDIERVGDYAENIIEYTARLIEGDIVFTEEAVQEIKDMAGKIRELGEAASETFRTADVIKLEEVESLENSVDLCKRIFHNAHIKRLNEGICTAENGAIFISLISNMERIGDHIHNMARSILSYQN